ncbi:hypothetical protein ACHQM5_024687 [Ranunculus cassubicifolius]
MMGSFLTRGLVMIFGYAYPAYECFKTVEKNKPEIEQLRFWCQYWILVALLTVFERVGDTFVSWVPMYSEAKLAFFIYLWYPKTKGTTYVYDSFFRPYVAKHETEIDRNLLELKTRAGDMAVLYWQRAATYGQTRVFEILQYVAAQSTTTPRPSQQGTAARVAILRTEQADVTAVAAPPPQPQQQQPLSRTSSSTAGPTQKQQASLTRSSSATSSTQQQHQPPSRTSSTPRQQQETSVAEVEPTTTDQPPPATITDAKTDSAAAAAAVSNANPSTQEDVVMEEVIRVTRGRLRKNRAVAATKT